MIRSLSRFSEKALLILPDRGGQKRDENIRGHVFCSFLALILRKELEIRLNNAGHDFEWPDIKQDLAALQTVNIEEDGKCFALRTECQGCCGKIFQAVRVALPPVIREVA